MKRLKSIFIVIFIMSILFPAKEVFAETPASWAEVYYNQAAGVRGEYTAQLHFDASDHIGIVTGEISYNPEYISIIGVEGADWNVSYNPNNGQFTSVKSTGAYSATIFKIRYKVLKACPGSDVLISINNIVFTSTSYARYSESQSLPLIIWTDHCEEHAYGDETIVTPASCTEEGLSEKVCEDCGDVISEVIPAAGHTPIIDEAVSSTCTETGLTEGSHCQVCGQVIAEQKEVPAAGHTWNEDYTVDKEATCTEEGSESIHCLVCDAVKEGSGRAIPKGQHTYGDWKTIKKATCVETGIKEKVCVVCGDKATEVIPAAGHTWDEDYTGDKEATCTEEGSESIHCLVCDTVKGGSERAIPAAGHTWDGDYTIDKEATYTEEGSKSIHCSVCGDIKEDSSRSIARLPKPLSLLTVSEMANKTYTGKALTPSPAVKDGSLTLKEGTDYTVSYKNNTNAGTATVTITGKGNYTGTKTATFKINKAAQNIAIKVSAASIAVGKTATVSMTGAVGAKSYKSSLAAVAAVNAAGTITAKKAGSTTITATAAATANYNAASKTVSIKVVPAATTSLTAANQAAGIKLTWKSVAGATGYKVYRGSTLIKTITSGSTITCTDTTANANGTLYTFKVVPTAPTGSGLARTLAFYRLARPAVSSVKNTAAKKMTVRWKKNAKATGYQIQYSTNKKFASGNKTANITKAATVSKVIGSLTKGKTYYVRIRTYKTVGKAKYWSAWSAAKTVRISK